MIVLMRSRRLLAWLLVLLVGTSFVPGVASATQYVCPPCGVPCDTLTFDSPGVCPRCGMTLVDAASAAARPASNRTRVAILVFDGVEVIDSMGPYEMFGAAGYDVYTVGATKQPVTAAMGQTLVPKYDFASAPDPDVLVLPGGGVRGAMDDDTFMAYVASKAAHAKHVMSVCNGAFFLAKAGLLDGLAATTTYGNVVRLQQEFPRIKVVGDQRYVDNGRIMTTAGLSAGIDGALHVIAVMDGPQRAHRVALGEEYDWHPKDGFVRPSLADRMLPRLHLTDAQSNDDWDVVSSTGDADQWKTVMRGGSSLSGQALRAAIEAQLESASGWTRMESHARRAPSGAGAASDWNVPGVGGERWRGHLEVATVSGVAGRYTATLVITRAP